MQQTAVSSQVSGFFLDGRWVNEGTCVDIRSPYDGAVVGSIHRGTPAHAEQAIAAAERAFAETRKMPSYERQRILRAIAQGIDARREEFARLMALEAGKPLKTARVEVERSVFTFAVAAEESVRIYGEWLPLDWQASTAGRWGLVRRFPLGPIAAITAFNFPLNLVAHKVAPAIAAGCTCVLKPAPQTPLTALKLAEVVQQAGLPAGALNVVPLTNEDAEVIVTDARLKLLSFTGSTAVGWALKQKAGKKRVALELGGNAGCIICSDANPEYAAERCVAGGFSYAGQSCISVQRILVERSVHQKFLTALVPRVQKLKVGNPLEETTDVGPMIAEDAARRAIEWVDEAARAGAKVLCGGTRSGSLLAPTVLTGTRPEMRVNCQEIFAPVVTVETYEDFGEAVAELNRTNFGLQAGLFTRDFQRILRSYEDVEVGGFVVGDVPTIRIDHMPYGGVKDSGAGREGLRYAIEEMTEQKLLVVNPAGL